MSEYIGVGTFIVTPKMRELVNQVLDSGRISYGPISKQFEQEFARIHECDYAVLSNSGTSSLQVALQTLKELHGWRDGDEIIVPSLTFVATINIVLHNKLTPVLVDVEPDYYGLDPALIERAITPRTRAIIPVHLFGMPCNMLAISDIAEQHNLKIIEDSCECMFVDHAKGKTGSWGDIGCFSTYVAHLLTTGVGGIATTNDPKIAAVMRSLVNHGRDGIYISIDDGRQARGQELREIINRRFRFERIGHSFRITELEAALGLAQLENWQEMISKRQENAAYLTDKLAYLNAYLQLPVIRPHTEHAFMMYPIVMRHEDKDNITAHLESNGIETRDMLPITNQPVYQSWCREDQYPVAQWINQSGFYIGCHQNITRAELDHIVETFDRYFYARSHTALTSFIAGT